MNSIAVLDLGGQYAHLIASRLRRLGFYAQIFPNNAQAQELRKVKGIIVSGGGDSVLEEDHPDFNDEIFDLKIPILGICYGHQLLTHKLGGQVTKARISEFGETELIISQAENQLINSDIIPRSDLKLPPSCQQQQHELPPRISPETSHPSSSPATKNIVTYTCINKQPTATNQQPNYPQLPTPNSQLKTTVWMSHSDEVIKIPTGFEVIAKTKNCPIAAMQNRDRKIYGLQFHPEVTHTKDGQKILENFAAGICQMKKIGI